MKNWKKFVKFVEENKYGAIATIDGEKPQVRAMVILTLDKEGIIYCVTNCASNKVKQIENNSNVSVYIWRDHDFFRIEGVAEISNDVTLKKQILDKNPIFLKHYSGPEDKKMCVIKIKVIKLGSHL